MASPNASYGSLPQPGRLPAAVLWDMDGTLIDSEPFWFDVEAALMARHGVSWTEADALMMVGQPLEVGGTLLQAHGNLPMTPAEVMSEMIEGVRTELLKGTPWRPGAYELLLELKDAGVPMALVTMSHTPLSDAFLAGLNEDFFGAVVTGDQVSQGKPHPEPYLKGAAALGVDVTECVAIEDSHPGTQSALASGAQTIAIPHLVTPPYSPHYSRLASLEDIDLALLSRIAAGERVDYSLEEAGRQESSA